jgi:hypothetical protein
MGYDTAIYRSFNAYSADDITIEITNNLDEWIYEYSLENFFGWIVESNEDCLEITLDADTRGHLKSYIEPLLLFLNECAKYGIHVNDSVPYSVSWGGIESGGIYINSSEKIVKIYGVDNNGTPSNYDIEWN